MKKEWILFIVSGAVTLGICLLIIRWFAPGLLGIPVDLQMIQIEKKVPPFFDGIFRDEDRKSKNFILQDPVSKIRAHPLVAEQGMHGPHDLLGFRNRHVPSMPDLVVIGDSQTYGVNVPMDFNWPAMTRKSLMNKQITAYNMSVGGWGGVQYYYIFKHALNLHPRAIVVAFYTGNDSLESFTLAYGSDIWKEFRVNPKLTKSDAPSVVFPVPEDEQWPVTFQDGIKTVFTPKLRLTSNFDHPAVKAGYEILAMVAEKISELAKPFNLPVVFTIIPTKELVYAEKIKIEKIAPPQAFTELVRNEKKNIEWLKNKITSLPNVKYVDVLTPLQQRAAFPSKLYMENSNGHPIFDGYFVIGNTIAQQVNSIIPTPPTGLAYNRQVTQDNNPELFLVKNRQYWFFPSSKIAQANGWDPKDKPTSFTYRDIAGYEYMGIINKIDKKRFGPNH